MANKTSKYLPAAIVVIIIAVVAGIQYFKNQKPVPEGERPNAEQGQSQNQPKTDQTKPEAANSLEGTLKISDNLKRGNLMLATSERTVYLFTSRDYSALLDKQVNAQIEGTLENFKLVDITAK